MIKLAHASGIKLLGLFSFTILAIALIAGTSALAQGKRVIVGDGSISFSLSSVPHIFDDILAGKGNMGDCQQRVQWVVGKTKLKGGKNNLNTLNGRVNYAQWLCSNLGDSEISSKDYKVAARILVDYDATSKLLYVKEQITNANTLPGEIGSKFKTTYTLARVNMSKFLVKFNDIASSVERRRKEDLHISVAFDDNNLPATR